MHQKWRDNVLKSCPSIQWSVAQGSPENGKNTFRSFEEEAMMTISTLLIDICSDLTFLQFMLLTFFGGNLKNLDFTLH